MHPKAETIDMLLDTSGTQQFNFCDKTTKTPKDIFDKRFELTDLHINSEFNDKVIPSDHKNATVFIKIDQEQYVPIPQTYQSVFASPNCVDYNTDQKLQKMKSNKIMNVQGASNVQTNQHIKQYMQSSDQPLPSSLYGEEQRGVNLEESMIDDKYNMSVDGSRNMACSQNISAMKSTPIMHAYPTLSKRDPASLG